MKVHVVRMMRIELDAPEFITFQNMVEHVANGDYPDDHDVKFARNLGENIQQAEQDGE